MSKPLVLDLYSCAGGAARGYQRAGFDVIGIDWTDVREELTEAIPPAYTEHIGRAFLAGR